MTRRGRAVSGVAVAAAVAAVLIAKSGARSAAQDAGPGASSSARGIPRLVDVGAGKCIPCKAMAPILEELRTEYAGRMDVQFIDVWQNPAAAEPFGVRTIPTQIFLGSDGRELARHVGFMAKSEILAQWKTLGVPL